MALAQTEIVVRMLRRASPAVKVQVVPIETLGDLLPPDRRKEVDGKSAFTNAIEKQLVAGGVDAAVHSMKDMPTTLPPGLHFGAVPRRGEVHPIAADCERLGDEGAEQLRQRPPRRPLQDPADQIRVHAAIHRPLPWLADHFEPERNLPPVRLLGLLRDNVFASG